MKRRKFPDGPAGDGTTAPPGAANFDDDLRAALKRCSPAILEAARRFRRTGDPALLPGLVTGILERFAAAGRLPQPAGPHDHLRLREDLGIDSLSAIEAVMLVEEVLGIAIDADPRHLGTVGAIRQFIEDKARGRPPAPAAGFALPPVGLESAR